MRTTHSTKRIRFDCSSHAICDSLLHRLNQALTRFVVSDLSNFYLDLAKDRLYVSHHEEIRRRSCQVRLWNSP
jgi:isoleucyl-tRNA synthetase